MKIIIGCNKKNFKKKIKVVSSKYNYIFYKYHFLRYYKIMSFITDRREEIKYNDHVLAILSLRTNNKILKLLERK